MLPTLRTPAHRDPLGISVQRLKGGDRGLRGAAPDPKGLTQSEGQPSAQSRDRPPLALGGAELSVSWA